MVLSVWLQAAGRQLATIVRDHMVAWLQLATTVVTWVIRAGLGPDEFEFYLHLHAVTDEIVAGEHRHMWLPQHCSLHSAIARRSPRIFPVSASISFSI